MANPEPTARYLALDVGSKRIGVAVSDELGLTAQPVLTLERRRNTREDLRSLARLARRFGVAASWWAIRCISPANQAREPTRPRPSPPRSAS
jgi:RNase H-fold protein (predicted Holliday junction resolvase)